jgi:hypothetical protein
MKSFENIDAKSVPQAVALLQKFNQEKKRAIIVGGGSEILQLMKDHVVTPDYVVNLKTIPGLNTIKEERNGLRIGALTTLSDIEEHPAVREKLLILSTAAGEAASPQIRNAGTIGGNICQRPFCWYFRTASFNCLRKGGQVCYTVTGDGRFHAILGGGPSYIVHPSDTAPALVALDAQIKITGPTGERVILSSLVRSSLRFLFLFPEPAAKDTTKKSANDWRGTMRSSRLRPSFRAMGGWRDRHVSCWVVSRPSLGALQRPRTSCGAKSLMMPSRKKLARSRLKAPSH